MMKRICAYSNNLQKKRNKPTGTCIQLKKTKNEKAVSPNAETPSCD